MSFKKRKPLTSIARLRKIERSLNEVLERMHGLSLQIAGVSAQVQEHHRIISKLLTPELPLNLVIGYVSTEQGEKKKTPEGV